MGRATDQDVHSAYVEYRASRKLNTWVSLTFTIPGEQLIPISPQLMTSVYRFSVYTVIKYVRKIHRDRSNTCSIVLAYKIMPELSTIRTLRSVIVWDKPHRLMRTMSRAMDLRILLTAQQMLWTVLLPYWMARPFKIDPRCRLLSLMAPR